ncbi:MAG TPA: DinB family protein [Caulobacteraceae bacterium]|nr:DinB family protein [Caulobacteraceae bacterium]
MLIVLFEHKAWCNARLVEALRAAPPEADRKTLAIALYTFDHTARVDQIFRARLEGDEPAVDAIVADRRPQLDVLAAEMAETDAWYLDYVRSASPEALQSAESFTFISDGEPGCMTRAQMLAHVIAHGASHRGAIGQMLDSIGVRGAPDMVTTSISGRYAAAR